MITYIQFVWGNSANVAAQLLSNQFFTVYPSGLLEIGLPGATGFSARFTSPSFIITYLPAVGAPAALNTDSVDPGSTSSGVFGGEVLALTLNIDLADAGFTAGAVGTAFGDLILDGLPGLNGVSVRDFLGLANTLLGGGANGYTIANLASIAAELNSSFDEGSPNTFAQDHLSLPDGTHTVPEPISFVLMFLGLAGLKLVRRGMRD